MVKRLGLVWLTVLVIAVTGARLMAQAPDVVVFERVNVVPMDRERMLPGQTVVVRDGLIAELGPADQVATPASSTRIDARGQFLMPTLAEMHAHILPEDAAPYVAGRFETPDEAIERVLLLYVLNGIGTIRNMHGHGPHIALRERVARGDVIGPTIVTSGETFRNEHAASAEAARRLVEAHAAQGFDFLKIWPELGRNVVPAEAWEAMVTAAHEVGLPFAGHVPGSQGLRAVLADGIQTVDHLDGYLEAAARPGAPRPVIFATNLVGHVDESRFPALAQETKAAGTWMVPTMSLLESQWGPTGLEEMARWPEMDYVSPEHTERWTAAKRRNMDAQMLSTRLEYIAIRRRLLKTLYDSGVGFLLGSDAPQTWRCPGLLDSPRTGGAGRLGSHTVSGIGDRYAERRRFPPGGSPDRYRRCGEACGSAVGRGQPTRGRSQCTEDHRGHAEWPVVAPCRDREATRGSFVVFSGGTTVNRATGHRVTLVAIALSMGLLGSAALTFAAQEAAALSGVVTSAAEGAMEGVVVTVRRDGAPFSVSVVSNAQGRYTFPRSHLDPGQYDVSIRAAGYDLGGASTVTVTTDTTAPLELALVETDDLASQLSSLEWLMSMPGTTEQKDQLAYQPVSCAYCHTYERITKSRHSAEEFIPVITRMQTYFGDGTAVSSQSGRGRGQRVTHPEDYAQDRARSPNYHRASKADLAEYLASINLSGGRTTWSYELETLPRPTGPSTRVIITQYDLPRPDTVPHDFTIDANGTPWYPDQSRMFFGKLDPKTGVATEYELPALPPGRYGGVADMQADQDNNIWFTMTVPESPEHFGFPVKFDVETEEITIVPLPDDGNSQFLELAPDGRLWMNAGVNFYRVDPETMQIDAVWKAQPKDLPSTERRAVYQIVADSKGNPWGSDYTVSEIVGVDAETGEYKSFPTPTPDAWPRRGRMDDQDRYWFAMYYGDRIGMFDTRAEQFQEWPTPLKYMTPYTVSAPDQYGRVYAPSNTAERLLQLDPETGNIVEFQMPTDFDTKKILHDPTATRPTLWMANTRNARLIRVELLN